MLNADLLNILDEWGVALPRPAPPSIPLDGFGEAVTVLNVGLDLKPAKEEEREEMRRDERRGR